MAANQVELGQRIAEHMRPSFTALGLTLDSFVVENLSLPEELQKRLDQRIGMNMIGDMNQFTKFQVAESLPIAAANEGGGLAGAGVGLGAGFTLAQSMMNAMRPDSPGGPSPQAPVPPPPAPASSEGGAQPSGDVKFCFECGKSIPKRSKFCPECGTQQ
jgi:membrane protease subunit (stomatin/prohibitin family)